METQIGPVLRALRRRADLSQRELAIRAGVPYSTIADIESGTTANPRIATVDRLVRAAGGQLTIVLADGTTVEPIETDELRDRGGRRYPAHLEVFELRNLAQRWGTAAGVTSPYAKRYIEPPDYTFVRNRIDRDYQRRTAARGGAPDGRPAARLLRPGDEPFLDAIPRDAAVRYLADTNVRHWIAENGFGVVSGQLAAHVQRLPTGEPDRLVVHYLRSMNVTASLMLVAAAVHEAPRTGATDVAAVRQDQEMGLFGFRRRPCQPVWWDFPR